MQVCYFSGNPTLVTIPANLDSYLPSPGLIGDKPVVDGLGFILTECLSSLVAQRWGE